MDKREALKIAHLYINSIKAKYTISQAFVFGSFAMGTNNSDSDIDIAIVLKNAGNIIDVQIDMMKLRRKIDLRIEPHPFFTTEFNRENPIVSQVLKTGIPINLSL